MNIYDKIPLNSS